MAGVTIGIVPDETCLPPKTHVVVLLNSFNVCELNRTFHRYKGDEFGVLKKIMCLRGSTRPGQLSTEFPSFAGS